MNSSLAFTANDRVALYTKSISSVQQNVLLFKGFLGPSLKDKPSLQSVGVRAARAAGVIVDASGKLRCPPGTPNANQFTDMQMSNCLVPGMDLAKRAVRASRREVGDMLTKGKKILEDKKVSGATKVAALTALATLDALDYMQVDGSGTMSAVTLIGVDLLRTVGRDVAELALNRLERKGKISKEQRAEIDKIIDKIHAVGSSKYTSAAIAMMRRRNRKQSLSTQTASMDNADAAPPDKSIRKDGLSQVTFDADSFNTELEAKITKLLDKYVPDAKNKDAEEYGDELIAKMGIPKSRSMKEMLDDGIKELSDNLLDNRIARLRNKSDDDAVDGVAKQRLRNTADQLEKIKEMLKTEGGKEAIRKELGKGFVEALAGAELHMQKNPSLRGAFTFEIHKGGDGGPETAGAYAWMADYPDGKIIGATRIYADSLLISNIEAGGEVIEKGDMFSGSVKIAGTDDYQIGMSTHEIAHIDHYNEILKTLGINATAVDPPALEQIRNQGTKVGDTFIGAKFGMAYGIDPDTDWKDVDKVWSDKASKTEIFGYDSASNLNHLFAKFTTKFAHQDNTNNSDSPLENYGYIIPGLRATDVQEHLFQQIIGSLYFNRIKMHGFEEDERISSLEKVRELVESRLDNQTIEDFLNEGKELFDEVMGFDSTRINTKGIKPDEIQTVLGKASTYGQTSTWEAYAEAKLLTMFTENFPDTKIMDDKSFDEMKNMLNQISPSNSGRAKPTIMTPQAKAWIKKLQSTINSLPKIERGSVI